jgi:hypothetical protein
MKKILMNQYNEIFEEVENSKKTSCFNNIPDLVIKLFNEINKFSINISRRTK